MASEKVTDHRPGEGLDTEVVGRRSRVASSLFR